MHNFPERETTPRSNHAYVYGCTVLSKISSLLLIFTGALVLLGWVLDNAILKSMLPDLVTMKANTAFSFVFLGIFLWIKNIGHPTPTVRWIQKGSAAVILFIGLATLAEYLSGIDFKIDLLFFGDVANPTRNPYPGRMAPVTAITFILFGILLCFFDRQLEKKIGQLMVLAFTFIPFLGFIGYLYNVRSFHGLASSYASMALHTSIAFVIAGLGILCSRSQTGIMQVVTSNTAGGILIRRLLPASILLPLSIGYLRLWGERQGYYGTEFGLSIFALSNVVFFTILIWRNGTLFYKIDIKRQEAERKLSKAYEELEMRVRERTRALQESEEKLVKSNSQMKAILDGANYSIISTELDGTITSFNNGAERMLGYLSEEVVGKKTPEIIHDKNEVKKRAEELSKELGKIIEPGFEVFVVKPKSGKPEEREWSYIRKDRSRFPVLLSVTPVYSPDQKITGFLGIASDITERKKIDRMKNEFISTVSHELRTPLTSIRGSLGLIAGGMAGEITPEAKTLIEIGIHNCERLIRLINDILDIEKIEAGKTVFQMKPLPLVSLIQQSIANNQSYAEQYKVRFVLENELTEATVNADEDRLLQVMTNLLSNAVKFSSADGTVTTRISRHPPFVRVSVIDLGSGIPKEFQTRLFEKFSQADSSDSRKQDGTGLGLSICKALIEKMGGKIGFVTNENGSIFYFDLPEVNSSND